jgi:hypothetical protein
MNPIPLGTYRHYNPVFSGLVSVNANHGILRNKAASRKDTAPDML